MVLGAHLLGLGLGLGLGLARVRVRVGARARARVRARARGSVRRGARGHTAAMSSDAACHRAACLRATDAPSHTPMPSMYAVGSYGPLFLPSALVESPSLNDCSAMAPRSLPSLGVGQGWA